MSRTVERFCVVGDKCDSSNLKHPRTWFAGEGAAIQHAGELLRKKGPGDRTIRLFVVKVTTVVELEAKPVYSRDPTHDDFPR